MELLLAQAQILIRAGDVAAVTPILTAIDTLLHTGSFTGELAADALALTEAALALGYEPYKLVHQPDGYYLSALDWAAWPTQHTFVAQRTAEGWYLSRLRFTN